MKLILHIGTHKTATTSIQHFCTFNKANLQRKGVYYPTSATHLYHVNFLASDAARGRWPAVEAWVDQARREAADLGCHTVFLSGESFYAMTAMFIDAFAREREADYWAAERKLVDGFATAFKAFETVEIACVFRPQDDLAASLYNQFVKNVYGIADDYPTFTHRIINLFDYQGHIGLWRAAFPDATMRLVNFEAHKADMIDTFIAQVLGPDVLANSNHMDTNLHANERLDRDLLEYKRLFNATGPDLPLAYMAVTCFRKMAKADEDEKGYQTFAALAERQAMFGPFQQGNDALAAQYNMSPLPVLKNQNEPTYPGLSDTRRMVLDKRFRRMMRNPLKLAELAVRRIVNRKGGVFPAVKKLLQPVRAAVLQTRLRLGGW